MRFSPAAMGTGLLSATSAISSTESASTGSSNQRTSYSASMAATSKASRGLYFWLASANKTTDSLTSSLKRRMRSSSRLVPSFSLYAPIPFSMNLKHSSTISASVNVSHPPLPYTGTLSLKPPRIRESGNPAALASASQQAVSTAESACTPSPPRILGLFGPHRRSQRRLGRKGILAPPPAEPVLFRCRERASSRSPRPDPSRSRSPSGRFRCGERPTDNRVPTSCCWHFLSGGPGAP